jgi:hypothetical protein
VTLLFDVAQGVIRLHNDKNNNRVIDAGERVRAVALGEGVVFGRAGCARGAPMGPGPVVFTKMIDGFPALVFHRDAAPVRPGLLSDLYSGGAVRDARGGHPGH